MRFSDRNAFCDRIYDYLTRTGWEKCDRNYDAAVYSIPLYPLTKKDFRWTEI